MLEAHDRPALQHARYRRQLMGANIPRDPLIAGHRALADAAPARGAAAAADLTRRHMRITSESCGDALEAG